MDENESQLWLNLCTDISPSSRRALIHSQGSARAARGFLLARGHTGPAYDLMQRSLKSTWMTQNHPDYPARLRELEDPPEVLFYQGDPKRWSEVQSSLTIVGTRSPSPDGRQLAGRFAHCLAQAGVSIVSGFARGIDAAAHRASLGHPQSPPLAVLACGLDYAYPPEHRELYSQIAAEGLLLSEYPPDCPVFPHHFQERNRLLAALGSALLVIEAPARSGTLITARYASELQRHIFVVPGPVDHRNYQGSLRLLQESGILVTSPRDVLEQLPGRSLLAGDCRQSPARPEVWAERWAMDLKETLILLSSQERSGQMYCDRNGYFGWVLSTKSLGS
ncbi:DNA-protecting protein DprA [bacterium]|nr:DNA-protecting protein DprA [bacterium]